MAGFLGEVQDMIAGCDTMVPTPTELVDSCIFCGICSEVCPFYKATDDIKNGAMAKVEAAQRLFSGKDLSEADLKTLVLCTMCDQCLGACPVNIPVSDIVQGARAELRRAGKVPEKYRTIADAIIKAGSPMGVPAEKRLACLPDGYSPPEKAKYLYYTGCWSAVKLPETAKTTMELLIKAKVDFTTLGEREWCCGVFLIDTGMLEESKKMAEENTLLLESTGAEIVVCECPSCHDVFKGIYPKLFRQPKYRVMHISELLKELIDSGRLKVRKDASKKVIYKDPCPLVRRHGISEEPRAVVSSCAELLEFDDNRDNALCCGAPSGVKPVYPEIADRLAEMLLDEAKEKGADEIAMGCVFCLYHMAGVSKEPGHYPRMLTLPQQVKEALEE